MKTQRKIIYSVIEYISGFNITDDNPYDEHLIADKIDDIRAMLIRQEWNDKKSINDLYYQEYDVDIEKRVKKDKHNSSEYLQFMVEFPELLVGVGWDNIKYLGKKDFRKAYNRRSLMGFNSRGDRRYTSEVVDYTIISANKAIIGNERQAKDIVTLALFKSPADITKSWDTPYPVPDVYKLELIVKQDIGFALGIKGDESNDSKHNQEQLLGQK